MTIQNKIQAAELKLQKAREELAKAKKQRAEAERRERDTRIFTIGAVFAAAAHDENFRNEVLGLWKRVSQVHAPDDRRAKSLNGTPFELTEKNSTTAAAGGEADKGLIGGPRPSAFTP